MTDFKKKKIHSENGIFQIFNHKNQKEEEKAQSKKKPNLDIFS
jgi:hypothetical protein